MNYFTLILLAIAPGAALIVFILLHDRYDKEPFRLLLKVFVFGMLAVVPTILVELGLQYINFFSGIIGIAIQAFIIVGLTEEFFKRLVVTKSVLYKSEFNEMLDGIVYCAIASLGFASIENIFYVINYAATDPTVWITRAFLSVPTHMLLGIIMGYYLSQYRFGTDPDKTRSAYRKALLIPAVLHGAFDFIIMSQLPYYIFILIPLVVFLWIFGMVLLRRYYKLSKLQFGK